MRGRVALSCPARVRTLGARSAARLRREEGAGCPLEGEQPALAVEAAAVADEPAVRPHDAVTREHDRDRVAIQGAADGARRPRVLEDLDSGIRSGVNGTPTLFVNGRRHDDDFDEATLRAAIQGSVAP